MARRKKGDKPAGASDGASEGGGGEQPARRRGRPRVVYGNNFDPDKVNDFVGRIEHQMEGLLNERMDYMRACKPYHETIRSIYEEAKAAGVSPRALKGVVKSRELEAKADKQRDDLEVSEQDIYDAIRRALGDFADTPLGDAALKSAEPKPAAGASTLDELAAKSGAARAPDDGKPTTQH